jgi:hypothetical protein
MSPDGKWVWNGAEWQPVGTHKSVFPSWNSIHVEPVQAPPEPAQAVMDQRQPVLTYPVYAVAEAAPPAPLWQARATGRNKYLYWVAGVVVLVMAVVFLRAMAPFIVWPWSGGADAAPAAAAPTALATRSDYARSDRFLRMSLTPAMSALTPTIPVLKETCNGQLTVSCQAAITATDKQVKIVIAAIDNESIPACIAKPVTKLRADLAASDAALQTSLKGYKDNLKAEVTQGLSTFSRSSAPLVADARAVGPAQVLCDTQVVGP